MDNQISKPVRPEQSEGRSAVVAIHSLNHSLIHSFPHLLIIFFCDKLKKDIFGKN